jgi:hypothetical protein
VAQAKEDLMGVTFKNENSTARALQDLHVKFRPIGQRRDKLLVLDVPTKEAASEIVEKELRGIPGFETGSCVIYDQPGTNSVYVQFFTASIDEAFEFCFDHEGTMTVVQYEGTVSHPVELTDSVLIRLAEKANKLYRAPGFVVPPGIPDAMLLKADVDDEFVQRLVAGRRLIVISNWSGSCPPSYQVDGLVGKLAVSRRQRAAKIIASPSGMVEISYHRAAVEVDEFGLRRVVQQPEADSRTWKGPVDRVPPQWRNAAKAAVEAAKAAEQDPKTAGNPVRWEDPMWREKHDEKREMKQEKVEPKEAPVDAT